jgi:DNA-binding MarR family transcriptional regulator
MKRDNYIMVPYEILDYPQLSSTDKLLYGLLTSLSRQKGYAFPSNGKLAEILNCSKSTISRTLEKLVQLHLIRRDFDKRQRKIYLGVSI